MRSTLLLLTAATMIGGYAYFIESSRPSRSETENAKDRVFVSESSALVELEVLASGTRTVLRKIDGTWTIVAPVQVNADEVEVSGITTGVASLEIERVLEDAADDLEPFGLADPRIEIAFKAEGDDEVTRLYLGNHTATGGDIYAMRSDDPRVFLVAAYLESSFDRTTFDLRDKAILNFERDDVDRLQLTTPTHTVALARADGAWRVEVPWEARGASGTVDTIVTRLDTARMQALIETDDSDIDTHGLAKPRISAIVSAGSASSTLLVGMEADDGSSYARDASRSLIFTVEASLVDALARPPEDYRQKELFTFSPTSVTRLEIERPAVWLVLSKDEKNPSVWRQLEPSPAEVDQSAVSDLLATLTGFRADRFVASTENTGLDEPIATVTVFSGERQERVVFGRDGDVVYALTEADAGAAAIKATGFENALAIAATLGILDENMPVPQPG